MGSHVMVLIVDSESSCSNCVLRPKCLHADDYLKARMKARIGEDTSNLESEALGHSLLLCGVQQIQP